MRINFNTDPENQPKLISLSNIDSFKSNDADSNAISDPVSLQNPVVKLANIYTPVISQWNNEEASGILIGGFFRIKVPLFMPLPK